MRVTDPLAFFAAGIASTPTILAAFWLSDPTAVAVAIIAAIPPTLAVLWSQRRVQKDIAVVHAVVNSRLDAALDTIKSLEAQIRGLKAPRRRPVKTRRKL